TVETAAFLLGLSRGKVLRRLRSGEIVGKHAQRAFWDPTRRQWLRRRWWQIPADEMWAFLTRQNGYERAHGLRPYTRRACDGAANTPATERDRQRSRSPSTDEDPRAWAKRLRYHDIDRLGLESAARRAAFRRPGRGDLSVLLRKGAWPSADAVSSPPHARTQYLRRTPLMKPAGPPSTRFGRTS